MDEYDPNRETSIIYYGSQDGFSENNSQRIPTYCDTFGVLADTNRNGYLDLACYDLRNYVVIYPGGQNGLDFENPIEIPVDNYTAKGMMVTAADISGNGYPDLIFSIMGHYTRGEAGFGILYGGPEGYSSDRMHFQRTEYSTILVAVADVSGNGYLDLIVPAYSTKTTRVLPGKIFWGNEKGVDFDSPFTVMLDASCAGMALDLNGNGYQDVIFYCHRDDKEHVVNSKIFKNGPNGLSQDNYVDIPGMGPHFGHTRNFGNQLDRSPHEYYISVPYEMTGAPKRISWDADIPANNDLRFQIRVSHSREGLQDAPWLGAKGAGSFFTKSGEGIPIIDCAERWIQYQAVFTSNNGCLSPKLREVSIDFS